MVSKLCIAFTKNSTTQEFVLRNGEELKEIMDLFDKIVPYACKDTIVESDTRVFHERWVGERFSVVFCMTEVSTHSCWFIALKPTLKFRQDYERVTIGNIHIRPWLLRCLNYTESDVSMTYKTACKFIFRDLNVLLSMEKSHDYRRRLALAMALHPRLGRDSLLGTLGDTDVLRMVAYAMILVAKG
jgi:hypothetical protein